MGALRRGSCRTVPARAVALCALSLAAGCALEVAEGPFADHEEASDFEVVGGGSADGVASSFDRNSVLTDGFFTDTSMITSAGMQSFLESTPYSSRSWLASYTVDGASAASAIVSAARAEGLNPVLLVARMQVEKSLVSRSSRPSTSVIDAALGCGCPDGGSCSAAYRGLSKQLACAARTLRRHYDGSRDGTGTWRAGRTRRSLDGLSVTPRNHATASLYAYTPWVLVGSGGNWLVWNITRRFYNHMSDRGLLEPDEPLGECSVDGVAGSCIPVSDCPSYTHVTTPGHCPGSSAIRCCTPVLCESGGRTGQCTAVADCDGSTHETLGHLCPGPATVRCCLPLETPPVDEGDDGAGPCGEDPAEGALGNDSADAAVPIEEALDETLRVCAGDDDYFALDLEAASARAVVARFDGSAADVDLELTGPDGELRSSTSTSDVETIELTPVPATGRYVLRVFARSGSGDYTLAIETR